MNSAPQITLRKQVSRRTPVPALASVTNRQHWLVIDELAATGATPGRIRNHCQLVDPDTWTPIYSETAIEQALRRMRDGEEPPAEFSNVESPESATGISTPKVLSGQSFLHTAAYDTPISVATPVNIVFEAGNCNFNVYGQTWEEVSAELVHKLEALAFPVQPRPILFHRERPQAQATLIANERDWHQVKRNGLFEVRVPSRTPGQPRDSSAADLSACGAGDRAEPLEERSTMVRQSLSFGSETSSLQSFRQKQVAYERQEQQNITAKLTTVLAQTGQISCSRLQPLLLTIERLTRTWHELQQDWADDVGVSDTKRLRWFLTGSLENFDADTAARWKQIFPREHQEVAHYSSLESFTRKLYSLLPANQIQKPDELIVSIASTLSRPKFSSLEQLLAHIDTTVRMAHLLATLQGPPARSASTRDEFLITHAEKKLWIQVLTLRKQDDFAQALQSSGHVPEELIYGDSLVQPLEAYSVTDIRQMVRGCAHLKTGWATIFNWVAAPHPGNGGNIKHNTSDGSPGIEKSNNHDPTSTNDKQAGKRSEFTLRNERGEKVTFPRHLKTVENAARRQQLESLFLAHNINNAAVCTNRNCRAQGHTIYACPHFVRLDDNNIETNEKNFFFGLRPPAVLLQLRSASAGLAASARSAASVMSVSVDTTSPEFHAAVQTAVAERLRAQATQHQPEPLNCEAGEV